MSHQHSGSCGCAEDAKNADAMSSSLYPSIDLSRCWCLNESVPSSAGRALKPYADRNDSRRLLSDEDDGELLLHVAFTSAVHVRSVAIMAWGDWRPTSVKLYVNRDDLDLSSVSDCPAAQELALADDTEGWLDYPLKANKFQSVSSLLVYVPGAVGGEGTQSGIQWIHFKGTASGNRREIVNVVYESRANPADHNKLPGENAASQYAQ